MAALSGRGKSNPRRQNTGNPRRSTNGRNRVSTSKRKKENPNAIRDARQANKRFGQNLNQNLKELPWVENPDRTRAPKWLVNSVTGDTKVPGHSLNARKNTFNTSNDRAKNLKERERSYQVAEGTREAGKLETAVNQLSDGKPYWKDPSTLSPLDTLEYDPITGRRHALDDVAVGAHTVSEEFVSEDTDKKLREIEESAARGYAMEQGAYSVGLDDSYWKQYRKDNYCRERQYNPDTNQMEWVYVLSPNAEPPEFTGSWELLGDYHDTWTYEKNGNVYTKPGAPEAPYELDYEFDDEGNVVNATVTKINYDYYITKDDGTWETYRYTDEERKQKYYDDWINYCAFANAANIQARQLTERMNYTAGWNPVATDSLKDIGADTLADASKRDYAEYSKGNRQGFRSMVGPHTASHLFKNVGGYLKTYLFTPLAKGDTQTAVINGLVNLGETCDYMGVGTRALLAPKLGIEYDKRDDAFERLAKAYTTHENYDPDTGSMAKDMGIYMLDPSIALTLGSAGFAKLFARSASRAAMRPIKEGLVKYGDDLADFTLNKGRLWGNGPLDREYKSIARDIAFADDITLQKHAERVAGILKESNYLKGTSHSNITEEVISSLRDIQNDKSFLLVKATAGASGFINGIDNLFLAGGLYLPYATLKTVQGTRSVLRSNSFIAKHLTQNAFKRYQNAQRIYKYYSGRGSIMDFRHVIDGFKSMKSLDGSEALKTESVQKIRKQYIQQQRKFSKALARFNTTQAGFSSRYATLLEDIKRIFTNDKGEPIGSLNELERTLSQMSANANGINKSCEDIFKNMLKAVQDAKAAVELAGKNDANSWLSAISNASSSREVRDLYVQYLSANGADPILKIESVAVDRYKWLYAQEHGVDKDLVMLPDDMILIEAARANGLDSIPSAKSNVDSVVLDSDLVTISKYVGDAPDAIKEEISKAQKLVEDLVEKDTKGNIVKDKKGKVQFKVKDYYVSELYNYIGHISKSDLSKLELSEVLTKTGRALDSLRGKFKADIKGRPSVESLTKFIEGAEDAEDVFVYSGGIDLMLKVLDEAGGEDYYWACRTVITPQSYVFPKKLRGIKHTQNINKLVEEGYRTDMRVMAADPNGLAHKKQELRHKLQSTEIKKEDGTKVTAYDEYIKIIGEYNKWATGKKSTVDLIGSLDILFNDIADVLALTEAQAEKAYGIDIANSTFLSEVMSNPVIMDAVHKFDAEGSYGFLIENKDEIAQFLKDNIEAGRDVPNMERLIQALDSIKTWRDSLDAYENFNATINRLELGDRGTAAVLEYCLGKNPLYLREASRSPYFISNLENSINRMLGADKLLIEGYRESVLRTSHIDESAWLPDHIKHIKACEDEIAEISKSDVKLQILQAVELGKDTIKRFNNIAKDNDFWFIKPVIDGISPDSAIIRFEMQKWVHVNEDISLPELLKVLQDNDKEYSHVFEISDDLTEEAAIKKVVDILDGSVKAGPGIKHLNAPFIGTHGKDVFDIDVLRQCCRRNNVNSTVLSNTNSLFSNRINTFKELMKQNRDYNCIDPDKFPKIAQALRTLSQDISDDASYSIFNVTQFSKDLDTLFDIIMEPSLIKEVTSIYDCEGNPFIKALIGEEKFNAMKVDTYDEAVMVRELTDKVKVLQAEAEKDFDLLENFREIYKPKVENYREQLWGIKDSRISREEKLERFNELLEKVTGSRWMLKEGDLDLKQIVLLGDISKARKEALENLNEYRLDVPRKEDEIYPDLEEDIYRIESTWESYLWNSILNNDVSAETLTKSISQLEDDLNFLWTVNDNMKGLVAPKLKPIPSLEDLNSLANELGKGPNNPALSSVKEDQEIIKRNASKPTLPQGPTPWFRSLYQSYHANTLSDDIISLMVELANEQKKLEILPETKALQKELSGIIDSISSSPFLMFDSKEGLLSEFYQIKAIANRYVLNPKVPQAVRNNLVVLSKVIDQLGDFTLNELQQFLNYFKTFDVDLNYLFTTFTREDIGFDISSRIETAFNNYNRRAALFQQNLYALQKSVSNRVFKEALNVTEASPFIRDIFYPLVNQATLPTTGRMCEAVREEVKQLNHIRSTKVNSCLNSTEFEGFEDGYAMYDLPMGNSAELRFNMSGEAFKVGKAYDLDNVRRIFNLSESRWGHRFLGAEDQALPYNKRKSVVIEETVGLLEEAKKLTDSVDEIEKSISLHKEELSKLEQVDELISKREEVLAKLEEENFDEEILKEDIEDAKAKLEKALKESDPKKYKELRKAQEAYDIALAELTKYRESGRPLTVIQTGPFEEVKAILEEVKKEFKPSRRAKQLERDYNELIADYNNYKALSNALSEIDNKLSKLPGIDEKYWGAVNYHDEMLSRASRNQKELTVKRQEVMDKLVYNYELLKRTDIADDVIFTKSAERELFQDIQKVIEYSKNVKIRVPVLLEDIPAHELLSLNKLANRVKYIRENKLKDSSFLEQISTLDDWNRIINQTRQFALAFDSSDPFHYLVYLKEAETIEDAFIVTDLLYNMFYKHWDDVKNTGHHQIEEGLMQVPNMYKDIVSRIMHHGYDSIRLELFQNPDIVKILQGDGLDLVYKGQPKPYIETIYYQDKINGKHAASANIVDILIKQNNRIGWAKKFASADKSIREEATADLERSQLAMLKIMKEVSGTSYEKPVRMYLDGLQKGLDRARDLKILDFITKDSDHLLTHLIYHNGHLAIARKFSDDFAEYGVLLRKLDDLLKTNPMHITYKYEEEQIWISLSRDTQAKILNDSKYVKQDTQFELNGKIYDPTEMNEYYGHIGLPDEIDLTEDILKDIDDEDILREYCERLRDYASGCYKKINFLTDGAVKGSSFAPYTLMKHRALRKVAPVDFLADAIRGSATCDQRLFHTSQFDFNILGDKEYRVKLGGQYDDSDILQNIKHCYDDVVGTVSTERMYIANFFDENSYCKLHNLFRPGTSDVEILQVLKNNPDQCLLTLVADSKTLTGFRVQKLRVIDELSIKQARQAHAIVADYETYVEMTRLINTSELDKVWMKAWARMVFLLKVGHLCNPGTWMRNWIDATIKATGEVDGNVAKIARDQLFAIKYLIDYSKIVKEVRDTYGVHHLTSRRLDNEWEAIQAKTHTKMTRRQFDFLESWLKVSLSGGESRMIQEMLKKQKYDPWRSGNLKPGDSFTAAGREAMKNEADIIGSDLYRFEQIGEDEINKLIEEGYRKGENIFADDFSSEEFWEIFNKRKNLETSYIEDQVLFQKYINTVENILTIRSNNLFRGNKGLGSRVDYLCSFFLKPMSKIEQVVRLGQFLTLEKEGFTRSEIFKSIADTQFEYELKSNKVKYAEFGITYFNFEYNNIRYWCNMLENKPEYLFALESLWNDLSWEAAQEYYQDENIFENPSILYMMANGALPIGPSGLYLKMFPSALGAMNWFYSMPSQFLTSVVPPVEILLKEMAYRMGGDYAQLFLSNMDYSYADQAAWEKALSMVPIAGTIYTRYIQHNMQRQPWKRLDDDSFGQWLVKCNPTVWGAVYRYNKPHGQDFEAWQAELAKQGKWYDANLDKVVDIKYKNTRGLNADFDSVYGDEYFDKLCAYKRIYRDEVWDNNWGGFVEYGHFDKATNVYFDKNGNPKDLGLNRYRDLRVPGEWEKLQEEMYMYHGRKWDKNTERFIPFWLWKEEKLNRTDLTFAELQEYMAEKGRYWDNKDHCFKSVPENMLAYNRGYYYRGWREFKRWVNYRNNPPARRTEYNRRRYNPNTTYNVSGRPYGYIYSFHDDQAALRMASSGYKAYDEYYKFEFQNNYQYRMPNPLNQVRRYNPVLRYHIIPK